VSGILSQVQDSVFVEATAAKVKQMPSAKLENFTAFNWHAALPR
jgi:hypothetical protein